VRYLHPHHRSRTRCLFIWLLTPHPRLKQYSPSHRSRTRCLFICWLLTPHPRLAQYSPSHRSRTRRLFIWLLTPTCCTWHPRSCCVCPTRSYVTVDEESGRALFYAFAESMGDPDEDPLVMWANGSVLSGLSETAVSGGRGQTV
jgi:hypothetical protein